MFFKEFFKSLSAYFEGLRVIRKYNFWQYMIIPGLISLGYAIAVIWLGTWLDDKLVDWLLGFIPWDFLRNLFAKLLSGVFWVVLFFFIAFTYRFVVLIILSPFLTKLSERVERAVTGQEPPEAGFSQFFYDIFRALTLGIRNLIFELLLTIPMYFIPILNPVGIFLTQSCYAGFGMIDFSLERKQFTVGQSVSFMRRHRGLCMGLGAGFQVLMLIPLVGWFVAPTLGTVAGTLRVIDIEEEKLGKRNDPPAEEGIEEIEIKFD